MTAPATSSMTSSAAPSMAPSAVPSEVELLPLHLALADRRVVVVGGGAVAGRKVASCLRSRAMVTVVSPELGPELAALAAVGAIRWIRRRFRRWDLRGAWLVYTATGQPTVDARVAAVAESGRTFCVRADDGAAGSARSAAVLRRDGVLVGVSSEVGADPRRVVAIRDALAVAFDSGCLPLEARLGRKITVRGSLTA